VLDGFPDCDASPRQRALSIANEKVYRAMKFRGRAKIDHEQGAALEGVGIPLRIRSYAEAIR